MSTIERMLDLMERGALRTIRQRALWDLLLKADPALRVDAHKREVLAEVVDAGVTQGRLRAPASRKRWTGSPPLPEWVVVQRKESKPKTVPGRGYFWRPELAWAATLRFRPVDLERLKQVNEWLRDMLADEPVVPLRERSLEIFGEEKVLERLLAGSKFFARERLTLEMLRARVVHPPFVYKQISATPVALVIENHHTYDSFCHLLGRESGVGVIVYGAGEAFIGSVTYMADLPTAVEEVLYFGDIDPEGLRIPVAASRVACSVGLPDVVPAVDLYSQLLACGQVSPRSNPVSPATASRLARWLPEGVRARIETLLTEGKRIAQEAIGTKALGRTPYCLMPSRSESVGW